MRHRPAQDTSRGAPHASGLGWLTGRSVFFGWGWNAWTHFPHVATGLGWAGLGCSRPVFCSLPGVSHAYCTCCIWVGAALVWSGLVGDLMVADVLHNTSSARCIWVSSGLGRAALVVDYVFDVLDVWRQFPHTCCVCVCAGLGSSRRGLFTCGGYLEA